MVTMGALGDDVASFPLPSFTDRKLFDEAYVQARQARVRGYEYRDGSSFAQCALER